MTITIYELLKGDEYQAFFMNQADANLALGMLNAQLANAPIKGSLRTRTVFESEADFWTNADLSKVPEGAILQIPDTTLRNQLLQAKASLKLTDAEKTALGITP